MDEMTANGPPIKTEKRRGARFPVVVPIEAKWQQASGKSVKQAAKAIEVNAQGGLLEMKVYPSIGSQLELTNLLSGEAFRARVVGTRRTTEGHVLGVAVELLIPSETFWGVNFRLKTTSAELVRLSHAMQSGNIDPRILREFRDAVDYVRKTAWAAEEWQERQLQRRDPHTVLPLITAERIRRATQLSESISADLAAHEVSSETTGMREFFRAVERVYQHLVDLRDRES
ncbi:MAG: hypothetical protein DMG35_13000 [Acidobacteria bacterium]|nr:MAG: hypothetical protein AUH86_09355 [Acidobacteria bacterium 13_1_40CM_4_58_4]PYT59945.1 MAG: hypothetical protein DMG35_13000 [Acidobacteriota bacterium]